MDQVIIAEKIESLRRFIQRIEDKKPDNVNFLIQDPDLQDILVINLTRAVQICVDTAAISSARPISHLRKPWVRFLLRCMNWAPFRLIPASSYKKRSASEISPGTTMKRSIGKLCMRFVTIPCRISAGLLRKSAGMLLCRDGYDCLSRQTPGK
jgi:hypothetical protein